MFKSNIQIITRIWNWENRIMCHTLSITYSLGKGKDEAGQSHIFSQKYCLRLKILETKWRKNSKRFCMQSFPILKMLIQRYILFCIQNKSKVITQTYLLMCSGGNQLCIKKLKHSPVQKTTPDTNLGLHFVWLLQNPSFVTWHKGEISWNYWNWRIYTNPFFIYWIKKEGLPDILERWRFLQIFSFFTWTQGEDYWDTCKLRIFPASERRSGPV